MSDVAFVRSPSRVPSGCTPKAKQMA